MMSEEKKKRPRSSEASKSGRMDSNHRYPAPKAGAIAARRRPGQRGDCSVKEESASIASQKNIWKILDGHYPEKISFLPVVSPFRFLVTVMLSASTTDKQAAEAAEKLFSVYPDPQAIASADVSSIEALIHKAGLSKAKSKNIKAMSAIVAESGIPETMKGLQKLPGVGEKTAACYVSEVLGKNAVIADTHFVRVAMRIGFTDTVDRAASAREIRERFDESLWTRISMVLNLHGRTCCKPKPLCTECPVSALCPSSGCATGQS